MKNKLYQIKRNVIKYFAQIFADSLVRRMQMEMEMDLEDKTQFWILYEQAAKLNAYCVVFHDIYLD
jgi:hypothetical protein